jgi:hypothetical protein
MSTPPAVAAFDRRLDAGRISERLTQAVLVPSELTASAKCVSHLALVIGVGQGHWPVIVGRQASG